MSVTIIDMSEEMLNDLFKKEMDDRVKFKLTQEEIAPLRRYIDNKILPGSFLEAVLRNNLKEAMGRADSRNRRRVFEYVEYLYNYAPAICWGSDEKYEAWLNPEAKDERA